jgi:hypothetical protein
MVAVWSVSARAAQVTYVIDPAQSYFMAGGSVAGGDPLTQTPFSNRTGVTGTLVVQRDGNLFQFNGGSNIDLLPQLLNQNPGNAPADFGLRGTDATFGTPVLVAVRNAVFDLYGDQVAISNGELPNMNDSVGALDGAVQWSGPLGLDSKDLIGMFVSHDQPITVTQVGGAEIIRMPMRFQMFYSVSGVNDSRLEFNGQIVALVPEPGAAWLLGVGALVLARRRRT